MSSSNYPNSRKQFANSMPASTRGGSRGGRAQEDTAPLSSSATFSAGGSKEVKVPHRPAAAPTKPSRSAATQPKPQPTRKGTHNTHASGTSAFTAAAATNTSALQSPRTPADATAAAVHTSSFPFDVYPPTVVFDSYSANTTYTATLELRNRTAVNKHVRVDRPNVCTAFELTAPRGAESSSKVAPGLSVTYTVVFTPTSSAKDYEADLVVRAEDSEPIVVPVRAYASRGCLHLPAALALKAAPMKSASTTPLFLRNTSERACVWRAAIYDLEGVADDAVSRGARLDECALSACFAITPHNGTVGPLCATDGQSVTVAPVTLHFRPDPAMPAAGTCRGLLRFFLGPEGDVVQDVQLSAEAVELKGIVLEDDLVTLADTYVTTERQAVVRVRNDSDETIAFSWRSAFRDDDNARDFYDDGADDDETGQRRRRPTRLSAETTHRLLHGRTDGGVVGSGDSSDAEALSDLFEGDEAFQIQPLSGVLYGRGVREFTITFNPHLAVPYESVAYLDVTGFARRLPLTMRGHGVGPQCKLEYNRLDVGDVYLNALHEYFVTMENTSAIECQYIMMPPIPAAVPALSATATPAVDFASKFRFTPSHGSLAPGESVKLKIELKSDRTGSFAETFHVHMQGAVEEVPLLLKGRVLGPHFRCDVDELDFGNVSYNMEHLRTMNIENTSPIPMHYALRLPDDCAYASDFVITPAEGVIAPRASEAVQVLFRSRTVGDYETALLVEVADVGDVLDAIPMKATCMVPTLHSSTTELTYGGVFVGYPTTLNVAVNNDTALTGMFELLLLGGDVLTDVVMVELPISAEHDDGVHWIAPHQTLQLPVTLTALKPGRLHFSLALHVLGRDISEPSAPPLTILVSAVASGPHIELQPTAVQFGTLDVLTEAVKELTLKNTSPVPAPFTLFFDRYGTVAPPASIENNGEHSAATGAAAAAADGGTTMLEESTLPFPRVPVFTVEPAEGVLEPHSSLTVRLRAKPDDAITFADTLRLRRTLSSAVNGNAAAGATAATITNGAEDESQLESDVTVAVKVLGRGVPIIADRPLESIELGDVLTTVSVAETITLHNYGRRDQEVQWQNTRGSKVKDGESPITFTYKPERASILAGGSAVFQLCGTSAEVGQRADTFQLKQSGTFKEVLRSTVSACFIAPTLSCSTRAITFDFANTSATSAAAAAAVAAPSLVKSLTMKNITSKPLVVTLRVRSGAAAATNGALSSKAANATLPLSKDSPFSLESPSTITLPSGESYVVGIRCNPLYRGDYTSHTVKAKLQLSFAEHDRKEYVSLTAALHFPSVTLQPATSIDFGTVLTNTEQRRSIELHNTSPDLPATFQWSLRPPADATGAASHDDATATGTAVAAPSKDAKAAAEERSDGTTTPTASSTALVGSAAAAATKVNGFDVLPFSGTLLPGEKRVVEVAYQGRETGTALATAVCHITGGPTYTVELRAAANVVQAHCDKTSIDFGRLPYYESASKVVTLTNTTQVPVPWQVDLSDVRNPACLKVSPMSGVLRDKARLQITFFPKVPDAFEEKIWVRVGHLDPQPIHIRGSGYMCSVAIATTTTAAAAAQLAQRVGASGSGANGCSKDGGVQVYRAPFAAFTEALQRVEDAQKRLKSSNPNRSNSAATASVDSPAELPAVLQKDWDVLEAERLAFCRAIQERTSAASHNTSSASTAVSPVAGAEGFLEPRAMRRASATAQGSSGSSTTKLVLARYVVDFGHLTRHDVRKAKLTIANPSSEGVNVVLDNKEFASLPISVDPVKGFKVAALETTTIEVTMDATKPESMVPHGENKHEFTMDIKNGPAVVVECRCYVATPSLRSKDKEVDFGAVLVGEVKVLPLVLTNPEAVACPWRVTCKELTEAEPPRQTRQSSKAEPRGDEDDKALGTRSARRSQAAAGGSNERSDGDAAVPEFWVKQDRGVVPASSSVTVEVYFAPRTFKAPPSSAATAANGERAVVTSAGQLKFRCGSGAATSVLAVKLSGAARYYQVGMSTEALQLPPARPNQVLQETVTFTNDEDHPVEVYNVALDTRHAQEIKVLRRALEVSPGRELLLPHLQAGEYLPDSLLESVFAVLHAKSDALIEAAAAPSGAAATAGNAADGADAEGAGKNGGKQRGSASGAKGGAKGGRKDSRRASRKISTVGSGPATRSSSANGGAAAAEGGAGSNGDSGSSSGVRSSLVVLVGPPRSGKTSVAQRWLSEQTDGATTVLIDLDALIRAEAERDDTANAAVARCLLTRAAEEAEAKDDDTAAAASETKTTDSCLACTPSLIRDLLQSFLISSIRAAKPASAPAAAVTSQGSGPEAPNTAESVLPSLRFVVDGLSCGVLANQWTLYELISSVCAAVHVPLHVVSLNVSTPMSNVRAAQALERLHEARVTESAVAPLSEAAYEALSRAEREDYNRRLKHMNDCRRDLQAAQHERRSWAAQLPHASLQAELEEAFKPAHGSAALDSTTRSTKAPKGAAAPPPANGDGAGSFGEPDWRHLDAAGQFCAWYKRFLQTYGCPPSEAEKEAAAAATNAASGAAGGQAASGRGAANAKGGAAAAAAAAALAAQEAKGGWSQVLCVNAESEQPDVVAESIVQQLEKQAARANAVAGTGGSAAASDAKSVSPSAMPANGNAAPSTASAPSSPGLAVSAGFGQNEASAEAVASQLGEWFYINDARLRSWIAQLTACTHLDGVSAPANAVDLAGAETGSETAAVSTATGAANGSAAVSALTTATAATSGAVKADDDAVSDSHRHVHFFATVEREVVQAKKPAGKKKSVISMVMQKEEVTRWMIPPHSSVTLSLEFCSDHVGKFSERCVFGVEGSAQQIFLTVSAAVALPDISRDAKDIFPVVKPRAGGGANGAAGGGGARRLPKVYIASKKVFDFGALLVAPPPTAKGRRRSAGGNSNATGASAEKAPAAATPAAGASVSSSFPPSGGSAETTLVDSHTQNSPFDETLTFVNREPAAAEVTLSFANDKEKTFTVTPLTFTLQPGATQRVHLRASPDKAGDFTNTLVATIKDNPAPWKVELLCTGARPTLSVNGEREALEADFGRLVLRRSLTKTFALANDGALPLHWKLVPVPEVSSGGGRGGGVGNNASVNASTSAGRQWPAELNCSVMEGVLEENEVQTVELTFAPTHPCLHNRIVNFVVSEVGQPLTTYETIPMTVKAEGYDVVVEWTRELQFGVLHVGEEKRETIRIMNKSPYDIGYQLRMPKRLQKSLTIASPSGTLRGMMGHKDAAIANIDVVARLEKEGELPSKLSLIEAAFFDVEKQELLYPLQTIPVTGEAWYTKYAVHPPSVAFGSCMVGQPRESTFELTNTGRFPIDYALFNYRDAAAAAATGAKEATAAAGQSGEAAEAAAGTTQRRSLKSLKGIEADFVVGAFTCRPCQGTVPVGGTQSITVSTVPSQQNRTHETIGVRVAQSGPELERYGTPVEVSAYPAAPSIAADLTSSADVETIFEEQRVVYRLDQLPRDARAYSREERVFSFGTVLVGQRCEERFRIANSSPLTCSVAVQLEGGSGAGGGGGGGNANASSSGGGGGGGGSSGTGHGRKSISTTNANGGSAGGGAGDGAKSDGFDIALDGRGSGSAPPAPAKSSVVRFTLPPFESRFIRVGFTPNSLSRLQAQLVATVDSSATPSEERGDVGQQLRFGLFGEGTLPTVELELPPRWTTTDVDRSRHSNSGVGEHLRGMDGSPASDRKKGGRRRQGTGSMSAPNIHLEGHLAGVGAGGADVLELPLTRVGAVSTRSFTVRNTGTVEAAVHLEMLMLSEGSNRGSTMTDTSAADASGCLSMRALTAKNQQPHFTGEVCRSMEVTIPAGQSETIELTYAPSVVEAVATRLRLVLASNPFEDKEVHVVSRSFRSAISFDGIDPASCDYVDIGDCFLGVDRTCTFSMRNNTDSLVRYTWELPETVRMVPSIGHLAAGASKTFSAIVRSTSEGLGQRVHCAVHAQSIVVQLAAGMTGAGLPAVAAGGAAGAAAAAASEWDNSMQSPKWVLREDDADVHPNAAAYLSAAAAMMGRRNLKQVMEAVPEPAYTVVDEVDVVQPLVMSYRCSVPTYQCQLLNVAAMNASAALSPAASAGAGGAGAGAATKEVKAIAFAQTYLLQKRVAVLRVTNTGSVALPYSCSITGNAFSADDADGATAAPGGARTWTAAELSAAAAAGSGPTVSGGEESPVPEGLPVAGNAADFSISSSSWTAGNANPSDLHVVDAGSSVDLNVAFTPRTVGLLTAGLLLRFPNSEPREMQVALQGVAECPLVHFNVPPLPSTASAQAGRGPLEESSTRPAASPDGESPQRVVVEFLARGLHTKATVRFPVVNPTSAAYTYEWVEENSSSATGGNGNGSVAGQLGVAAGGAVSPFRCLNSSGVIAAGRSVEAVFEFFADALGTREAAWQFRIPGRLTIPFRLRGTAVEPRVYLHASKVNFDHVQVGTRVERTVVLENCEDMPFPFAWDKTSLEGTSTFLSVKPLRGTLAPREQLPITLSFSPQEEMEHNVPLRCAVKKASAPLSLNVKGVGINVHDSLQIEPASETASEDVVTVLRGQPCSLDLGRVQVNGSAGRRFVLRNTGTYAFHYSVDAPANPSVACSGAGDGVVEAGQSAVMVLQYKPTSEEQLKQCRLVIRIEGSVAYKVNVRAVAYLPRLQMSFDRFNFGPRFIAAYNTALATSLSAAAALTDLPPEVQEQRAGAVTQELLLTNVEAEPVSVECAMATQNVWCALDCTSLVVRPKETARLKLTFTPTEARLYEDVLKLCFNGIHTAQLVISGEGVVPRVEVANPYAKLGSVRVGESRAVEVRVQCLSKIHTPISFARAMDEDLRNKGIEILLPGQSSGGSAASSMLVLKPKEAINVSVVFAPTHRMSEFSREVKMLVCGVEVPFVSISGSCVDAEVHLDTTRVVFRDVVIGATATRKVVLLNSGDVAQKFSWVNTLQQIKPAGEVSVTPSSGFVRPHTEVTCEVRYSPTLHSTGKKRGAGLASNQSSTLAPNTAPTPVSLRLLQVEFDSAPALTLSVETSAVTRPAATETVQFACRARETEVKMIEVRNTSDQPWTVEPVMENPLWTCPAVLTLKPNATTSVPVTYNPVRSTLSASLVSSPAEGADKTRASTTGAAAAAAAASIAPQHQKDRGQLYIPLPDGMGRCVALEGVAEAPGPSGPVQRYDAIAHASLPLRFAVHNWSPSKTMRFRREVEWTAGPGSEAGEAHNASVAIQVHESESEAAPSKKGSAVPAAAKKGNKSRSTSPAPPAAAARDVVEVAPKATKECLVSVTPLRDGVFRGVVRFQPVDKAGAPIAGDAMQQFFEVEIDAKPAPAAAPTTVELRAAIRELASFNIPLTNPLAKPVEFTIRTGPAEGATPAASSSALPDGLTVPTSVVVPALSHGKATVTYFPLLFKKTPSVVQCSVSSAELGAGDAYQLRLTTTSEIAAPERVTQVTCPLGQHVSFTLRFTHFSRANTEFAIRVGGEVLGKAQASFSRVGGQGSSVKVAAVHPPAAPAGAYTNAGPMGPKGQEVAVEFSYEPFDFGEERQTIEFVSPVAGTYVFPVVATCTAPQRQGPFSTRAGQNLQLPFKNVFNEPVTITVSSDSPAFVPAKKTETVPAHKSTNVVLQCKADEEKDVVRGRVSITCTAPSKGPQQSVEWLYYVEVTGGGEHAGAAKQSGRKK